MSVDGVQLTREAVGARPPAPLHRLGLWPRPAPTSRLAGALSSDTDALPTIAGVLCGREGLLVLAFSAAWYLLGVWYLLVYLEWYDPDTLSRLGNAFYVLYSREPHLAAIGFVWPPLQGLAMLPLLALAPWWPTVASHGLAAGAVTGASGALFATVTFAILRVGGLPRWACWGFIAALWANPMWWYASANGLSEMPFLLLLLLSSWLVWRWLSDPRKYYLAVLANGLVCAAALMIRYETLAWATALSGVTFLGCLLPQSGDRPLGLRARLQRAWAFTLAFALPWGFTLVLWIFFSWQTVGDPFYFVSGAYACRTSGPCTTAMMSQARPDVASIENTTVAPAIGSVGGAVEFVVERAAYLNPALFGCLPLATLALLRRGAWQGLGLIALALSIVALDIALLYLGSLASLLRYHLASIPATLVLMAWLYRRAANAKGSYLRHVLAALIVGAGALMAVTSGRAMADPILADETREAFLHFTQGIPAHTFNAERELAAYLDSLDLPSGSVLIDSANGYGVIVSSRRPTQFVIDSDSDFLQTVANPQGRVGYMALGVNDNFDIVAATYPRLFETGEPFGIIEREFDGAPRLGHPTPTVWRLYRLTLPADENAAPPTAQSHEQGALLETVPDSAATHDDVDRVPPSAPPPIVPEGPVVAPTPRLDERFFETRVSPAWPRAIGVAWGAGDGYHLAAGASNRFVAVGPLLGAPLRDVRVTGQFRKIGGPPGGGYGLIVRDIGPGMRDGVDQSGDYCVLEAGDRGEFGIWRRARDHWIDIVGWTPSFAVLPGGATNVLEALATGDQLTFKINGVPVAQTVGMCPEEGAVGVFVGGDLNQGLAERFTADALN